MTSLVSDMNSPGLLEAARAVLEAVDKATELLAVSKVVPAEVAALVDSFDRLLYARNPEAGLASVDPYLVEGLLGGAVVCLKALRHDDPALARRDLRLGLEQVRQALRDLADERPVYADQDPKELVRWLVSVVSLPHVEVARVLRVAPRTLQRWLSETDSAAPSGQDESRLRVVSKIVNHLRHSFTGPGTLRWLDRPHPRLDGEPPSSLLDDEARFGQLVHLAARARSMVAT